MAQPAGIEGRFWFFFSSSLEIEDSGFRMSNRGVCTFCGLLCGDIDFSAKPSTQTCPKAAAGWLAAQPSSNSNLSSLQSGISISRQQALEGVAKLFSSSRRPLLSGLATDVAGVQQMVDLASRTSAILDHMHGPALQTNLNLLQQTGLITTTLSEVRFRADAIILVGDSVLDRFPRLLERIDRSAESEGPTYFHGVHSQKAKVVQLHRHADLPKKQQVSKLPIEYLCAENDSLLEVLGQIRRKVFGDTCSSVLSENASAKAHSVNNKVQLIADLITQSKYSVWIWSAADFQRPSDDLILDAINEIVHRLNQHRRSVVLPLAGSQGDTTAMQVCTWKTGFPLRQCFSNGSSHYDPSRYSASAVVSRSECDLLCYVSSFEPIEPSSEIWDFKGPKIVIGHPALRVAKEADYFIPAGIPGIDHTSHLFRGDSTAVLLAKAKREALHPSVASIIREILDLIPHRSSLSVKTPNKV
jgi:formylmethanofuran dehydrogenase subunit B